MKLKHLNPKNWLITFSDWYIQSYHSADYIHLSKIQDEITLRVNNALEYNNNKWNEKIEALELKLNREYVIKENGWCAEIIRMEKIEKEANELKKQTLELDHIVKLKAHEIVLLTAEIKEERKKFIENNSASIGMIDKFIIKSESLLKESKEEIEIRKQIE